MTPRFWFAGSHGEFPPSALLEQAAAAEQAGWRLQAAGAAPSLTRRPGS